MVHIFCVQIRRPSQTFHIQFSSVRNKRKWNERIENENENVDSIKSNKRSNTSIANGQPNDLQQQQHYTASHIHKVAYSVPPWSQILRSHV